VGLRAPKVCGEPGHDAPAHQHQLALSSVTAAADNGLEVTRRDVIVRHDGAEVVRGTADAEMLGCLLLIEESVVTTAHGLLLESIQFNMKRAELLKEVISTTKDALFAQIFIHNDVIKWVKVKGVDKTQFDAVIQLYLECLLCFVPGFKGRRDEGLLPRASLLVSSHQPWRTSKRCNASLNMQKRQKARYWRMRLWTRRRSRSALAKAGLSVPLARRLSQRR
jgi:hypothetical protein